MSPPRPRGGRLAGAALASAALVLAGAGRAAAADREAVGIVEPRHDALLSAPVAGTVAAVDHPEGDAVAKDAVLLTLDDTIERLEVARRKLVWENRAKADAAAARVETLARDLASTRALFEKTGSVSREALEKKELEHRLAEAEYEDLKSEEAREKIEYEMADAQLARRQVRAPFAGVVTRVFLDPGEACEPRQPLVRLVDARQCYLVANIEAALAARLRTGRKVSLVVEGEGGGIPREGTVEFVSSVVDPASGLQRVKVLFDNEDGRVRPGLSARLAIPATSHEP